MAKSKKISLSKIIKETEVNREKAKKERIKCAYRDLLSLLENIHSAHRVSQESKMVTIHIFSSIARSESAIHNILETISGCKLDIPRLNINANHENGGRLHYDVIIYKPRTNLAATAVQINMPEGHLLTPEMLDDQYNALLDELRNRAK